MRFPGHVKSYSGRALHHRHRRHWCFLLVLMGHRVPATSPHRRLPRSPSDSGEAMDGEVNLHGRGLAWREGSNYTPAPPDFPRPTFGLCVHGCVGNSWYQPRQPYNLQCHRELPLHGPGVQVSPADARHRGRRQSPSWSHNRHAGELTHGSVMPRDRGSTRSRRSCPRRTARPLRGGAREKTGWGSVSGPDWQMVPASKPPVGASVAAHLRSSRPLWRGGPRRRAPGYLQRRYARARSEEAGVRRTGPIRGANGGIPAMVRGKGCSGCSRRIPYGRVNRLCPSTSPAPANPDKRVPSARPGVCRRRSQC